MDIAANALTVISRIGLRIFQRVQHALVVRLRPHRDVGNRGRGGKASPDLLRYAIPGIENLQIENGTADARGVLRFDAEGEIAGLGRRAAEIRPIFTPFTVSCAKLKPAGEITGGNSECPSWASRWCW